MGEEQAGEEPTEEARRFGLRDLARAVNLKDFSDMVGGELEMIASSMRVAGEALPKVPFGPVFFLLGLSLAVFRSCLLLLVVVFFGSAILAITVARGVTRLFRGSAEGPER
ncbi:MAG: hypothetical protein Q8S13_00210 [Dehalococcoidia bacterium]|nr:hypothetical protein [Dehalococcoidia bacterium]